MESSKEKGILGETIYKNPSFVSLQISRVSSTGAKLFGSQIIHHNYITLAINECEYKRDEILHTDWYFGSSKPIIEIAMSAEQFAEAITTLNYGSGTPATLTFHNDERFELPNMPTKAEQFKSEIDSKLKEKIGEINNLTKKITTRFEDSKPLKADEKKELLSDIENMTSIFKSYLPFVMRQFQESMDHIVTESKSAVEEYVNHVITQTGLDSIKENKPKLIE
jgi:hypothetical protein